MDGICCLCPSGFYEWGFIVLVNWGWGSYGSSKVLWIKLFYEMYKWVFVVVYINGVSLYMGWGGGLEGQGSYSSSVVLGIEFFVMI